MLTVLDLFSGIGGMSLGLESTGGFQTVAFCEIEPFPRLVLEKHWPGVPIFKDVRTLTAESLGGLRPDLICGGFPCQDISVAGKGAGLHGQRSGLWFEYARLVGELRPRWVLAENVGALRTRGVDRVCSDLEGEGYAVWPLLVGAWAAGAPHKRERVWIVGRLDNSDAGRRGREGDEVQAGRDEPERTGWPARPGEPQHEWEEPRLAQLGERLPDGWASWFRWGVGEPESAVAHHAVESGRSPGQPREGSDPGSPQQPVDPSVDGLSRRLVRLARRHNREVLKAVGNSVVPQVVHAIGRAILATEVMPCLPPTCPP